MKSPKMANSDANAPLTQTAWIVDRPTVSSEVIEGELVAMNLATGHYFSSLGVGVTIWACLQQGSGRTAIIDAVEDAYEAPRSRIEVDFDAFLETLRSHRLVRPYEGSTGPEPADGGPGTPSGPRVPYEAPEIVLYSDMRDLLLLDPIHEVSDAGWPQRAHDAGPVPAGKTGS